MQEIPALELAECWQIGNRLVQRSGRGSRDGVGEIEGLDLNASVEELTRRVSSRVVQVLVTGYGPIDQRSRGGETGLVIGRGLDGPTVVVAGNWK